MAEARYFGAAGYRDILYAVGLSPNKFSQLAEVQAMAEDFTVTVDSAVAVHALCDYAAELAQPLAVVIEIDVDDHRAGLLPQSAELLVCAKTLVETANIHFRGLLTHAGGSYACFSSADLEAMATRECAGIGLAAEALAKAGIDCDLVSAGSTPTALAPVEHRGINEIRAGVYATFDCVMAGLGVCQYDDIAMSVLTSVIGQQVEKNWVLVDAGWMALSSDTGTSEHPLDCGYGLVCDEKGDILDGWYVAETNQEHGIIRHRDGIAPDQRLFGFGKLLRILPIHACATAAHFSEYQLVDNHNKVIEHWSRISGW